MRYSLHDLLIKMGAPEVGERNHIEWHYFDNDRIDLAGFAEVRLEADGARLVAELRHTRQDYEDDHGTIHDQFEQSFHLLAERVSVDSYDVKKISFDGAHYEAPARAIIELGLSLFHARALDISIRSVERAFNRDDILDVILPEQPYKKAIFAKTPVPARESFGTVIPFRRRQAANA